MAGGVFVGQDTISLIRQLAASSDPEDPGCSRTHAAPLAAGGLTHFPSLFTCAGGLQSQQVVPYSRLDEQRTARTTRKEGNWRKRTETAVASVLRSADPSQPFHGGDRSDRESGTDERGTVQRPPSPPFSFNASGG